jgi:signal peptide peptidase SppA
MPNSFLTATIWVIEKSYLDIVDEVIRAKLEGRKRDLDEIEAAGGKRLHNERPDKPYEVYDGVAVIRAIGVIGKRMNLFSRYSGGVSTEFLQLLLEDALTDPAISAVVLAIDSPGGTVDGTVELADWMLANRGIKPVYGYVDGTMASGALWIGSACDKIYGYRSTQGGSMGVVMCHYDRSGQDEKAGVKRTFITSGEYKRIANDAEPLSEQGKDYLQEKVDYFHSMFVEAVAAGRGLEPEEVQERFGNSRMFVAEEAKKIGMIDAIGSLAETIDAARAAAQEEGQMNKAEILVKFPVAAAEIMEDGRLQALADFEGRVAEQGDALVASEQERLIGLYGSLHGEEKQEAYKKLVDMGVTAEQLGVLGELGFSSAGESKEKGGENSAEAKILAALEKGDAGVEPNGSQGGPTDFMAAVEAHMQEHSCGKTEAMKAISKKYPELHQAYRQKG